MRKTNNYIEAKYLNCFSISFLLAGILLNWNGGILLRFFVKFGADYPDFERTTFRLNSSNPALPYISLFLFFNLFT